MQIRINRQRGNVFVGVFVLVIGAVAIWKLYVTAKKVLADPVPPPPETASNNIPTNLPPNITVNANWFENDNALPGTDPASVVLVVYGLEHTNQYPTGLLCGQPVPVVPAIQHSGQTGGSMSNLLSNLSTYGLSPTTQSTWWNANGDWNPAYPGGYAGLATVPGLWGVDVGGPAGNGFYLTTLQRSTNGRSWTNLVTQWMHGGTFAFYVDPETFSMAQYRVVMDDGKPVVNPAVTTWGVH